MAKLIVMQSGREKTFDLIDDIVFVGNGSDCAIRLDGPGVAERHCQILKVDAAYRLVDLGGGIRVNGEGASQHELNNGDVIQVGGAVLTFRGGVRPEAAAPAAAAPAAPAARPAATTSRSSTGRRRPRRGGRRPAGGGREIAVGSHVAKAAGQREILKRQNVRKEGLSGPATMGIALCVITVLVICGYFLVKGLPGGDAGTKLEQAKALFHNSKPEAAIALLEQIPEEAPNYRVAQELLAEIKGGLETKVSLKLEQHGEVDYQNNILGFVQAYVEKEKYAGDTAYIRILVKRCKNFLVEYKGHKREREVKSYLATYESKVPKTAPTAHEVYLDADIERARYLYGIAYVIVTEWLEANPGADEGTLNSMRNLQAKILRCAKDFWKDQLARAEENIVNERYDDAYSKFLTAVRRLEGIPDMHRTAVKKAEDLKKLAEDRIVRKP